MKSFVFVTVIMRKKKLLSLSKCCNYFMYFNGSPTEVWWKKKEVANVD